MHHLPGIGLSRASSGGLQSAVVFGSILPLGTTICAFAPSRLVPLVAPVGGAGVVPSGSVGGRSGATQLVTRRGRATLTRSAALPRLGVDRGNRCVCSQVCSPLGGAGAVTRGPELPHRRFPHRQFLGLSDDPRSHEARPPPPRLAPLLGHPCARSPPAQPAPGLPTMIATYFTMAALCISRLILLLELRLRLRLR